MASATLNSAQQLGASFGTALLSTWAGAQVTSSMIANGDAIRAQIGAAIASARLDPASPEAAHLATEITAGFRAQAAVAAYGSGFQLLAGAGYVLTVALTGIALVGTAHRSAIAS